MVQLIWILEVEMEVEVEVEVDVEVDMFSLGGT